MVNSRTFACRDYIARHYDGSRTVFGARVSLVVGLSVAVISSVVGIIFGLLGGYYRRIDLALMRVMDALMAFPGIVLAVAIMAAMGARVHPPGAMDDDPSRHGAHHHRPWPEPYGRRHPRLAGPASPADVE